MVILSVFHLTGNWQMDRPIPVYSNRSDANTICTDIGHFFRFNIDFHIDIMTSQFIICFASSCLSYVEMVKNIWYQYRPILAYKNARNLLLQCSQLFLILSGEMSARKAFKVSEILTQLWWKTSVLISLVKCYIRLSKNMRKLVDNSFCFGNFKRMKTFTIKMARPKFFP